MIEFLGSLEFLEFLYKSFSKISKFSKDSNPMFNIKKSQKPMQAKLIEILKSIHGPIGIEYLLAYPQQVVTEWYRDW